MPIPFVGEVKLVPYTFAPIGWAFCEGQILPISQNTALFSLLGTYYGGNGVSTFGLPDLRDRNVVGIGSGPGLTPYDIGDKLGNADVTLDTSQIPVHSHDLNVSGAAATLASPSGAHLAAASASAGTPYGHGSGGAMPGALLPTGGSQPHENRQPFLTLRYIIALQGIYPSRD